MVGDSFRVSVRVSIHNHLYYIQFGQYTHPMGSVRPPWAAGEFLMVRPLRPRIRIWLPTERYGPRPTLGPATGSWTLIWKSQTHFRMCSLCLGRYTGQITLFPLRQNFTVALDKIPNLLVYAVHYQWIWDIELPGGNDPISLDSPKHFTLLRTCYSLTLQSLTHLPLFNLPRVNHFFELNILHCTAD